eukprot:6191618-Pleurochrysis_carterae.AAC.2
MFAVRRLPVRSLNYELDTIERGEPNAPSEFSPCVEQALGSVFSSPERAECRQLEPGATSPPCFNDGISSFIHMGACAAAGARAEVRLFSAAPAQLSPAVFRIHHQSSEAAQSVIRVSIRRAAPAQLSSGRSSLTVRSPPA